MNRTQLIERITEHTGVEKKAVANVLAGLGDVVLASVAKGDSVLLPGIAKFTKVKRKARVGRNTATGAAVKIPAKTVAKVTALKLYKETVLGNNPAPKLQKVAAAAAPAKATTSRATTGRTAAKAAPKTAAKATSTRASAAKAAPKTAAKPASTRAKAAPKAAAKAPARTTKAAAKPAARTTRTAKAPAKPRTTTAAGAKPRAARKA
jgi:DNA-binding protein HU-beta